MKIAVYNTKTRAVDRIFETAPGETFARAGHQYRLPNGERVSPLALGWKSGDLTVVEVVPFEVPAGKRKTGAGPIYELVNGKLVESYAVADIVAPRRSVRKSVVQDRLIAAGKITAAFALLQQDAALFARWFAPDRSVVYVDDPDALAFLAAIEADPAVILAEE